ncbi:hypothetical protein QR685DRAFT_203906 [Neurospora intermedia]|uniref:Questionable protein n=1 Tax=Neurospora intermedia TaxID=5142 RepID=A0ABR3DFJ8_NEUIN
MISPHHLKRTFIVEVKSQLQYNRWAGWHRHGRATGTVRGGRRGKMSRLHCTPTFWCTRLNLHHDKEVRSGARCGDKGRGQGPANYCEPLRMGNSTFNEPSSTISIHSNTYFKTSTTGLFFQARLFAKDSADDANQKRRWFLDRKHETLQTDLLLSCSAPSGQASDHHQRHMEDRHNTFH